MFAENYLLSFICQKPQLSNRVIVSSATFEVAENKCTPLISVLFPLMLFILKSFIEKFQKVSSERNRNIYMPKKFSYSDDPSFRKKISDNR